MNLYFSNTVDQDPTNSSNWWDGTGGTGTNGYTPTTSDDCFIDPGQTCSTSNFNFSTITVDGILTDNVNGKTVSVNNGTVTTNSMGGVVVDNNGVVGTNSGNITNRNSGGSTTSEYEAATVPSGYTVTNLYVNIDNNNGTISNVTSSGSVSYNNSLITTNNGYVGINSSTITTNNSSVSSNASSIVTNSSSGIVGANTGTITTNNGTVFIGTITGGSGNLSASGTTNLSSHTAGTNVTFPTTPINWW